MPYKNDCFFKLIIKIEVNKIVDITENKKYFKGSNVIRQIDIKIIETGILWKKRINLNFFFVLLRITNNLRQFPKTLQA